MYVIYIRKTIKTIWKNISHILKITHGNNILINRIVHIWYFNRVVFFRNSDIFKIFYCVVSCISKDSVIYKLEIFFRIGVKTFWEFWIRNDNRSSKMGILSWNLHYKKSSTNHVWLPVFSSKSTKISYLVSSLLRLHDHLWILNNICYICSLGHKTTCSRHWRV